MLKSWYWGWFGGDNKEERENSGGKLWCTGFSYFCTQVNVCPMNCVLVLELGLVIWLILFSWSLIINVVVLPVLSDRWCFSSWFIHILDMIESKCLNNKASVSSCKFEPLQDRISPKPVDIYVVMLWIEAEHENKSFKINWKYRSSNLLFYYHYWENKNLRVQFSITEKKIFSVNLFCNQLPSALRINDIAARES